MEYPLSNTMFILLINFRIEIRFSSKTGLRSHAFQIKGVLYVLPNLNHLGWVVWNPIWIKSNLKPVVWTQSKIYFGNKSITRVCRAKSLIGEKDSCFLKKSNSLWLLSVHIFFKIPQTNRIRDVLFTCLRKHEYLQYPKIWCQFRCLNYRYKSDILILNEKWH